MSTLRFALVLLVAVGLGGTSAWAQSPEKKLLASADVVAAKVAKVRGLAIKRPIKRGVMNKAQLKQRLLKRVGQEYSPDQLAAEELLLKRFGLLEVDQDYLKIVLELLAEQVAGFYDPWEKQLYIANFQTIGGDVVLAHEIDHALQDQHFNLRRFMGKVANNNDERVARQALVEGDGMAVMIEFMLAGLGQSAPWGNDAVIKAISSQMSGASGLGNFDKAPLFLKEGLVFPYLAGLGFVAHFRKNHPWGRINRIYKKPPLSSEHILHPRRYEAYERPDEIEARALTLLPGHQLIHHDVNGELGMSIWLMEHGVKRARAELAAAGWGGDRLALLTPKGHKGLSGVVGISDSVWDQEADAIEFFEAAVDAMSSYAKTRGTKNGDTVRSFATKSGLHLIERRGDRVVLALGLPKTVVPQKAVDEVFKRWKVRRR